MTSNKGFTLIELLVVIMVMSIISSLVIPYYKSGKKSDLNNISRRLVSNLRYVRSDAIRSGKKKEVHFDLSKNNYVYGKEKKVVHIPDEVRIRLMLDWRGISENTGRLKFYPDGSSSGASVELEKDGKYLTIVATWLSGNITVRK